MTKDDERESEPVTVGKYQRSVALDQQMAERLHKVCEHLGVTVSAYLKQVIGEAVCRHEVTLLPKEHAASAEVLLADFFKQIGQVFDQEQEKQDEKPKRQRVAKAKRSSDQTSM